MVSEINSENFEQEVILSDKPVLVDFWGPKCVPCLALSPHVDRFADAYQEKIKVTKLDASKNRRLCLKLKVVGLPTFLIYKEGKEVARLTGGDLKVEDIEKVVQKVVG